MIKNEEIMMDNGTIPRPYQWKHLIIQKKVKIFSKKISAFF